MNKQIEQALQEAVRVTENNIAGWKQLQHQAFEARDSIVANYIEMYVAESSASLRVLQQLLADQHAKK